MTKIKCLNCDATGQTAYESKKLNAMFRAGFELRHLECESCGQQELIEYQIPKRLRCKKA